MKGNNAYKLTNYTNYRNLKDFGPQKPQEHSAEIIMYKLVAELIQYTVYKNVICVCSKDIKKNVDASGDESPNECNKPKRTLGIIL